MGIVKRWRRSIKWKFTLIFVLLILFLLLCILLANTFLLERYYLREKVRVLEDAYTVLDRMIVAADEEGIGVEGLFPDSYSTLDAGTRHQGRARSDIPLPDSYDLTGADTETAASRYLKELSETNNLNVVILDTVTDRSFTFSVDSEMQERKLAEYVFGSRDNIRGRVLAVFSNYSIEQNEDRKRGSSYLESWGYFSDNTTSFIMSMPVAAMKEATGFFNRFLLFIGMLVAALGTVIVYIASRAVTKPINALARLSEKMSTLDFSARYQGHSQDEIGTLGNSMNSLSEHLESSIAELKTANNELQLDIENRSEIDRRRQEFVANVSHELKTPIALIQGYAEGLQDGMAEDPESREYYCGVIVDEAKKMNRMVLKLMNLSAIEQGKDLPDITLFQLRRLVQGAVTASEILIAQMGAQVEVDIPEDCKVWADEFKIEEVVTNYLSNALHHLEEPKQISIFTEKEPGNRVSLHVANTGKQIPEEDLEKVWEKFYKVDKAHTRTYGGSGLGLSIVKAIADVHHQKCGVRNTRTGVDFWFTMEGGVEVRG